MQWRASGLSQRAFALKHGIPIRQALFAQQQAKLAEKDFKITALTHELAYYRRIRFGKASEALNQGHASSHGTRQ